jgi:hypothetical protein
MKVGMYVLLFDVAAVVQAMHVYSQQHVSTQAKLSRLIEACAFFVSNGAQNLFRKMTGSAAGDDDNETNGQQ